MSYLEDETATLIAKLQVSEAQAAYLQSRWAGQIIWMDAKAKRTQRWFYAARIVVILGTVSIPPLVMSESFKFSTSFRRGIVLISLLVAFSTAIESFFHLGDKWRHYRANVEALKSQGWLFSLKTGPYKRYESQAEAFPAFAERIEDILQRDVSEYFATVADAPKEHGPVIRAG